MSLKSIAVNILDKISVCTPHCVDTQSSYMFEMNFIVLVGNDYPRWIVPTDNVIAKQVLKQWRPYGKSSFIKWQIFRLMYILRVAHWLPGTHKIVFDKNIVFHSSELKKALVPVVYVGTPGQQQKAVVTLVDPDNALPMSVMKVALAENAAFSLKTEANMLDILKEMKVENVPRLISIDENHQFSLQSVISGSLSGRALTQTHIELLSNFPIIGKSYTFYRICEQLKLELAVSNIGQKKMNLQESQVEICRQAIIKIEHPDEFSLVMIHGDFSPWNLKIQSSGQLAAIDWEDAKVDGLPLWDLCHFYFIQEHLFQDVNALDELSTNPLIVEYLKRLSIDPCHALRFILLYCVGVLCSVQDNVNGTYKTFLCKQITRVISR